MRIRAAGAADAQHAVLFRIEIEQDPPAHDRGIQIGRTGQPGLLVDREQEFERATLHAGIDGRRHRGGDADSVVRTQRGARGDDPTVDDCGTDRIALEIVFHLLVFFAHHVEVALDHDGPRVLPPGRGGHHDDDVSGAVLTRLEAVHFGPFEDPRAYAALLFGWSRNGRQLVKM